MPNRTDAQLEYTSKRLFKDRPLEHGKHTDLAQNAHQNQLVEESTTSSKAAASNSTHTFAFVNTYSDVVASAGFVGISPLTAGAAVESYGTDVDGNYTSVTVNYENTGAAAETLLIKILGVPL